MDLDNQVFALYNEFRKITPILIMRRFKVTMEMAEKLCQRARLRMHNEASKLAKEFYQ